MIEPLSFANLQWLEPLIKKLLKIRHSRKSELDYITNVFSDPLLFLKYYIEPHCQHKNPADLFEEEPISTPRGSTFRLLNNFFTSEFINRDGANQMFLLADAGMGKTSLLIFLKISHLTAFWPGKYNCELIKLDAQTITKTKNIPNSGRTILLLDALDEDPTSRHRIEERLYDLLSSTKHFFRVIITCRTQYIDHKYYSEYDSNGKINIGPYQCPAVYLSLFDEEQVNEYLHKRFPETWKNKLLFSKNLHIEKSAHIIHKMKSLKLRPLLLSYIDEFIDEDPTKLNEYKLYTILVNKWINREIRTLHTNEKNYSIKPQDLFEACANIACIMHINDSRTITEKQLSLLTKTIKALTLLKDFDLGGRSLLNRTSDGSYRFAHYSILEFLVAYAIKNNFLAKRNTPVRMTDMMKVFIFQEFNRGMKFRQIILKNILFKDKEFSNLDFSGCKMISIKFTECNLNNASFKHASLEDCQLEKCSINNSDFSDSKITNSAISNTSANDSNFKNATLKDSFLSNSRFNGVEFLSCKFINTSINATDLNNSLFDMAELRDSLIEKCGFEKYAFKQSVIKNTNIKSDYVYEFNWRTNQMLD